MEPQRLEQQAPPDTQAPAAGTLIGIHEAGIDLEALEATALARRTDDHGCLHAATALASATTRTARLTANLDGVQVAEVLTAETSSTVRLTGIGDPVDTRAVTSRATGTLTDLFLLDERIRVAIVGEAQLTAQATGEQGGATAAYTAPVVTVTIDGVTTRHDRRIGPRPAGNPRQ